jgi:hypothetical protein
VASPTGQINAVAGAGNQSVSVNFTTDDGYAATDLTLTTDLSTLPAGWTSASPGLTCAIVSSGSGCQLALGYAPTAASRGTLTLNYGFTDDAGVAQTGALNIHAATFVQWVAIASPAGQINAIEKTGGVVAVTFNSDDGTAVPGYLTRPARRVPACGWSSAATASPAPASALQWLSIAFDVRAHRVDPRFGHLNYVYGNGGTRIGSLNLEYAATTNDNVVGRRRRPVNQRGRGGRSNPSHLPPTMAAPPRHCC